MAVVGDRMNMDFNVKVGVGYPQVPGSYALTRNLNFAFLSVVNDATDPRETILDYTKTINDELRYKREELGFAID